MGRYVMNVFLHNQEQYEYVDIDVVSGEEVKKVREELKKYNPSQNVPTIVIDDGKDVIIGYKEVLSDGNEG
jgi:glutaredoxin